MQDDWTEKLSCAIQCHRCDEKMDPKDPRIPIPDCDNVSEKIKLACLKALQSQECLRGLIEIICLKYKQNYNFEGGIKDLG
jgi:hypothetical protein